MKPIIFSKMVAAGNDFIVVDVRHLVSRAGSLCALTRRLCSRKYGIGADGVLLLEKAKENNVTMRIFNADGSEAEMCGNGARCAAWFIYSRWGTGRSINLHTPAGIVGAEILTEKKSQSFGRVKVKLTTPEAIRLHIPLKLSKRICKVNFINTGVPHLVIFVHDLAHIDVKTLGKALRFHRHFAPHGTNVNFVQIMRHDQIQVRTYERGVEDETLACGTGVSASAIITALELKNSGVKNSTSVLTQSGEILKVHFTKIRDIISCVSLEGDARIVFDGTFVAERTNR